MERSSRRDRSRDPEEDISSDTGDSTRLRSRRMRDARSSAADSTSDGADTDASSAGTPQRRRRRSSARKAVEDPPKTTRELRSSDERHSSLSGDEEEDEHEDARNHEDDAAGRKRSLSNVSNTSSTSASSMASEPLTAEQRRAHVDQQMAELEQKKKMVEDGTLAEFCRRVTAFKEERNRLLQTAELHKNLQLKNGQDLYKFEVQRAQHLWQNDRKVLKDELLAKVDAVMAKLQAEMKVLSEPGAKITDVYKQTEPKPEAIDAEAEKPAVFVAVVASDMDANKQASEPEQEEGEVPEPPVAPKEVLLVKRRKMDPNACADPVEVSKLLPVEAVRLAFDDITADIAAIAGDCKKTSQSTVEQLPNHGNVPFKLERRRLLCGKYVYEDGDEVHVSMPLVHEEYTGTISSITDDAIYIKLASGQKVRISLPHFERRRCELKPLLRGAPSTGSLHSMGWSEYDTSY